MEAAKRLRAQKTSSSQRGRYEQLVFVELIAFSVGHHGDADADGHGWKHKD